MLKKRREKTEQRDVHQVYDETSSTQRKSYNKQGENINPKRKCKTK